VDHKRAVKLSCSTYGRQRVSGLVVVVLLLFSELIQNCCACVVRIPPLRCYKLTRVRTSAATN
jgi:hypothetical protein